MPNSGNFDVYQRSLTIIKSVLTISQKDFYFTPVTPDFFIFSTSRKHDFTAYF